MNPGALLQAAVVAALRADPALAGLTGVFDCTPVRSALPHAVVDDPVLTLWGAKDLAGREGRLTVVLHDGGERPVRLRTLIGDVETRVEAVTGELGGGWRVALMRLARSRMTRGRDTAGRDARWMAMSEFAVKLYRADG